MRHRVVWLLALTVLAIAPVRATAASGESRTWFTPFGGITHFDKEFGKLAMHADSITVKDAVNGGLRIGHVMSNGLGLEIAGGYTPGKAKGTSGVETDLTFIHVTGNIIFSPTPGSWGAPWISAGFGAARTTVKGTKLFPDSTKDNLCSTWPAAGCSAFPITWA